MHGSILVDNHIQYFKTFKVSLSVSWYHIDFNVKLVIKNLKVLIAMPFQ